MKQFKVGDHVENRPTAARKPTRTCPHCNKIFSPQGLAKHEPVCKKYPGAPELLKLFETDRRSISHIAKKYEVCHGVMESWLRRAGAKRHVPMQRAGSQIKARWEFSILDPCQGRCADCGWLFVCRERVNTDRPILSEAPLESELELWIHNGWVSGEGLRG